MLFWLIVLKLLFVWGLLEKGEKEGAKGGRAEEDEGGGS